MPTTYRRTNTDSDLGGGTDFNKAILDPALDTTGTQTVNVPANTTQDSFGYTDVDDPSDSGVTGDYTVEMDVVTGQTDINLSCAVARVNSSGTQQAISTFSAEQTATAGTHAFSFTSVDLGTWATGDRLRITYRYRNTHTHTSRDIDVNHGGANNEVIAPWSTTSPVTVQASPATLTVSAQAVTPVQPIGGGYTFRGIESAITDASTATITINKPPDTVEGDFLIASIMLVSASAATWQAPSGWTQLGTIRDANNEHQSTTWWKIAGASESTSYDWTIDDNVNRKHGTIAAYAGVESTPIDAHTEEADASSGGMPIAVTSTVDGVLLYGSGFLELHADVWTNADGMTTRYAEFDDDQDDFASVGIFDELAGAAGSYTRTFEHEDTGNASGHLIAFAPTSEASPVTVQASPASVGVAAQAANPQQTALTVSASPASTTVNAQAATPTVAPVVIQAAAASLSTAAQASNPTQAALAIQATSASLTTEAQATSPTVSGSPVTIQAAPATVATSAQTVTPTQSALTVSADPATLTATSQAASPQQAALTVSASPATTTASASTVSPQVASEGVTIQADPATLATSAQAATPTTAALTVQVDPVSLTATGQVVQPADEPVVIQAAPASVSVDAQSVDVALGGLSIQVNPAVLSTQAQALTPSFDALVLQAAAATLGVSASPFQVGEAPFLPIIIPASYGRQTIPASYERQTVEETV